MWVHIYVDLFSKITVVFSIHGWESADVENLLYPLIYASGYREPEHLWILVSVGELGPIPHRY